MLPMPGPAAATLHVFLTPALYVFACVLGFAAALRLTARPWPEGYLLAALGGYGLMLYHQYVGRSHPYNWFHVCIPAVILATVLGCLLLRSRARRWAPGTARGRAVAAAPAVIMAATLVLLAASPSVRAYPGLLSGRWSVPGILWDLPGAGFRTDPATAGDVARVRTIVQRITDTVPAGEPVAILSEWDGLLYVLADRRPFCRLVPLYTAVNREDQVDEVLAALAAPPLRHVFLERGLGPFEWSRDLPPVLFARVARDFDLVDRVENFEVWRRRGPPAPSP
jgi:hypothetical protein